MPDLYDATSYWQIFVKEAARAASRGQYERLRWLVDRSPEVIYGRPLSEDGREGENILHMACRAGAKRCVELCIGQDVSFQVALLDRLGTVQIILKYMYIFSDSKQDPLHRVLHLHA